MPAPQPDYDVLVVGAGVAGASLAISLARDGRSVLCVERTLYEPGSTTTLHEPRRIVGELLQPGGYAQLHALGLGDAVVGIDAVPIFGYGLFMAGRAARIGYTPAAPAAPKAKHGCSFHNGRFLRRLREIARDTPNLTLAHGAVTALLTDSDSDDDADADADARPGVVTGVRYTDADGASRTARAKLTVACDGCSSSLRRRAADDVEKVAVYSNFHGLILEMAEAEIPFAQHGHVVLADPAPVLFYPISSTEVRCLVDIPVAFRAPFEHAVRAGHARMMPNRVMPAAAQFRPGAILLGDAFNMRHPLTGGGMTVALSDISILRAELRAISDLRDDAAVTDAMTRFRERRKPLSTTINILANALYTLFCAADPALRDMRAACFAYITAGGRRTHDPMGMLGGLKPYRFLLVAHFFAVALFGCGRALLPWPTPARAWRAWSIFRASFNVIKPLIDAERLMPLSWIPFSAL